MRVVDCSLEQGHLEGARPDVGVAVAQEEDGDGGPRYLLYLWDPLHEFYGAHVEDDRHLGVSLDVLVVEVVVHVADA